MTKGSQERTNQEMNLAELSDSNEDEMEGDYQDIQQKFLPPGEQPGLAFEEDEDYAYYMGKTKKGDEHGERGQDFNSQPR